MTETTPGRAPGELAEELIRLLLHRVEENTAVNLDVAAKVAAEIEARLALTQALDERHDDGVRVHTTLAEAIRHNRELLDRLENTVRLHDNTLYKDFHEQPSHQTQLMQHARALAQKDSWRIWWRGIVAGLILAFLVWAGTRVWNQMFPPPLPLDQAAPPLKRAPVH